MLHFRWILGFARDSGDVSVKVALTFVFLVIELQKFLVG